jgi:uncharacterized protein (DUF488 family)
VIYTVGHSTHPFETFVELLRAHGITQLADIRTVPRSRRHPHFSADGLAVSLPAVGVEYRHFPELGGLRKPRRDSRNSAWKNEGFRGYADYMETPAFRAALEALIRFDGSAAPTAGSASRTALMCAEAVWWRCHRQLVADALVARGMEVAHIMSTGAAPTHALTDFAQVEAENVTYRRLI